MVSFNVSVTGEDVGGELAQSMGEAAEAFVTFATEIDDEDIKELVDYLEGYKGSADQLAALAYAILTAIGKPER